MSAGDAKAVGRRIRVRREALGISQGDLAKRIGVDQPKVSNWERGSSGASAAHIADLAVALETTSDDLLADPAPAAAPEPASMPAIPFHPYADLFPLITGAEFDALVDDMRANGFRGGEEIVLFEGRILDGRNRCRAAIAAGIIPPDVDLKSERFVGRGGHLLPDYFREFGSEQGEPVEPSDGDALGFVISRNLHRRHLTTSQRAMIAAKLATLEPGRPSKTPQDCGVSTEAAATALKVGARTVEMARHVVERAAPEVAEAVTQGQMSVASAETIASLPVERQREIIKAADPKALRAVVGEERARRTAEKKARRTERETDLAAKITALPDKRYGVIYADPEWRFEPRSRETGMDRAADNHYPTSPTEAICARPVGDIAADHCVLFLWGTAAMFPDALQVLAAWGFTYVTNYIWDKKKIGPGYWQRNRHEHLLIGTRGAPPCPAPGTQWDSIFDESAGEHSAKPDAARRMIEEYFPNLPKIELNARAARPGWDVWGNEVPE